MFNFLPSLREIRSLVIGIGLILASAVIGLIWVSIGLYALLTTLIGPVWGPFVLGVIGFVPLMVLILHQLMTPAHRQVPPTAQGFAAIDGSVGHIARIIDALSERSVFLGAVAAVVAGFLATRFPAFLSLFAQMVTAYAEDMKRNDAKKAAAASADETAPAPEAAAPRQNRVNKGRTGKTV